LNNQSFNFKTFHTCLRLASSSLRLKSSIRWFAAKSSRFS
jgi:hypothetical protein